MNDYSDYFQVLFEYVESTFPLAEIDKELCRKYMKPASYSKEDYISKEGQIPLYHNFIVSGYARNYHIDELGEEVTVDLNDGPRFFTSYDHFMNKTISNENLQCITDCKVLRLNRSDIEKITEISTGLIEYSSQILQSSWAKEKQRMIDRMTLSAEARYLKLIDEHPNILKYHQLNHIASFLGIKPGSLSRIRKDISQS